MTSDVIKLPIHEKKNFGSVLRSGMAMRTQVFMTSQWTMGSLKVSQEAVRCANNRANNRAFSKTMIELCNIQPVQRPNLARQEATLYIDLRSTTWFG